MKDITVLITAAGSPSMPGIASCLKENGERNIYLIGTDMKVDPTIEQFVDECVLVPAVSDETYVDCLLKICTEKQVDILIPGISDELILLCERQEEFANIGTRISVSNRESIETCVNKFRFYEFVTKNGIGMPKYCAIRSLEDFDKACAYFDYPNRGFVVKTTESSGSRGVRILDPTKSRADILFREKPNSLYTSLEDLRSILAEAGVFPEMMAMEYLPGREYSVDVLAEDGEILYICGRESIIVNASIPMEAELAKNEEAYEICKKVVKLLGISGNADFDFKFDAQGHPVLMEVNPRMAATMAIFRAGGLNLLYLRVKQLLGEKLPEQIEVKYGVRMKRRYLEQFAPAETTGN